MICFNSHVAQYERLESCLEVWIEFLVQTVGRHQHSPHGVIQEEEGPRVLTPEELLNTLLLDLGHDPPPARDTVPAPVTQRTGTSPSDIKQWRSGQVVTESPERLSLDVGDLQQDRPQPTHPDTETSSGQQVLTLPEELMDLIIHLFDLPLEL